MKQEYSPNKYFKNFINILKKTRNLKTHYLPNPYKLEGVRDYEKNKNFLNFKKIFDEDFLIHNTKKFFKSEVIFLSHYLGHEHIKDNDFYYGKIFDILKKKKINYSILMINKSNYSLQEIKKKFRNTRHSRVYLNHFSHPLKDFKLIFKLLMIYLNFFFKIKNVKLNKVEKKIISEKFSFSNFIKSRTTLKLANNIEKILDDFSNTSRSFIFTFEGHAFERMIIEICKKKRIKSVGYFFSVLRPNKTNIFYEFPDYLMPDKIFTTGLVVENYFNRNLSKPNRVYTIGSGRKFIKKKFNFKKIYNTKNFNFLICPEGLYTETDIMFNLGLDLALNNKKINVTIRLHPELKENKKYINILKNKIKKIRNYKISNNTLESDIKNNQILIYRGSSICVNGVLGGMIPMYFKIPNKVSIDPLFEVDKFKAEDTSQILKNLDTLRSLKYRNKLNREMRVLIKYCNLYYEQFNSKNILKYLRHDNK